MVHELVGMVRNIYCRTAFPRGWPIDMDGSGLPQRSGWPGPAYILRHPCNAVFAVVAFAAPEIGHDAHVRHGPTPITAALRMVNAERIGYGSLPHKRIRDQSLGLMKTGKVLVPKTTLEANTRHTPRA